MKSQESNLEVETEITLPTALLDKAMTSSEPLVLLPQYVDENGTPVFAGSVNSVRKILHEQGLSSATLPDLAARYREDRSFEWVGPTLLIPAESYLRNKAIVDVALKAIGAYVSSLFKGREHETTVRLDVLCVRVPGLTIRRLKYRGPVEGLKKLAESVRATMDDTSE